MNGLTLRISGNIKDKRKAAGVSDVGAVRLPDEITKSLQKCNFKLDNFLIAVTANEQLKALTTLIEQNGKVESQYDRFVRFLVQIYYHSPTAHPLKSFLSRHVSKHESLQLPFNTYLSNKLKEEINKLDKDQSSYKNYVDVVGNIISCTDCKTIKSALALISTVVLVFLTKSLQFCSRTLRSENISPTDKNKIYQLAHTTLRAILHMIQNTEPILKNEVIEMYDHVKLDLFDLFHNVDVPMDTKSLSGILYLHFYILRKGPQSWTDIFKEDFVDDSIENWQLLDKDIMNLILYSAIAVVIPTDELETTLIERKSAIFILTDKIISLGERNVQECTFILGVSRTVVQLCNSLNRIQDVPLAIGLCELHQRFVWTHVDHHLDSVRYLTTEALAILVRYCGALHKKGETAALDSLLESIISLTTARKAYFLALAELAKVTGTANVLLKIPGLIDELILSLNMQHVKASAATTLESLLENDKDNSESHMYDKWISPILRHISQTTSEEAGVKILGNILAKIFKRDNNMIQYILPKLVSSPYIDSSTKLSAGELKCVLVLLTVARKSGAISDQVAQFGGNSWKGVVDYQVVCDAAVHSWDEIRLQSLCLIVETHKSTELITEADFKFILHFMLYNMNTQSSAFRQQMLASIHKFFKRIEDTYKVLIRSTSETHKPYKVGLEKFVADFRELCFDSLLVGCNYSRRQVCLQGILWTHTVPLEDKTRVWKEEYLDKLLFLLEDSFEQNQTAAVAILMHCPLYLLITPQCLSTINVEEIVVQASRLKPMECVSAAHKLRLLNRRMSQLAVVADNDTLDDTDDFNPREMPELSSYCLIKTMLKRLEYDFEFAEQSFIRMATLAPMFGLLHCLCEMIKDLDYKAIASNEKWTELVDEIIQKCMKVNQIVCPVVNCSSPEGFLPPGPSMFYVESVREVLHRDSAQKLAAQKILLCAWRCVKEVSLILGEISNKFAIKEESASGIEGNITEAQLLAIGEHFTALLTETKHRGAFEQAYVGFTKLLDRLWRSKVSSLHSVPGRWTTELLDIISSDRSQQRGMCATRRSAGVPFMIQALVSVEVQVVHNPTCFFRCMDTLLLLANGERLHNPDQGGGENVGEGGGDNIGGREGEGNGDGRGENRERRGEGGGEERGEGAGEIVGDREGDGDDRGENRGERGGDNREGRGEGGDENREGRGEGDGDGGGDLNGVGRDENLADGGVERGGEEGGDGEGGANGRGEGNGEEVGENGGGGDGDDDGDRSPQLPVVHALNILRALYRHTGLSNAVSKYVESGMITAIKGFSRNTWAERNAATLLLGALVVRVFGVVRGRHYCSDDLALRNRMTGRIFFLRYPNMYHYMLNELQSIDMEEETLRPTLFPILLILGRLYPSSLEGTTTNFRKFPFPHAPLPQLALLEELSAYVSEVWRCASSHSLHIRQLAASAIVPLISCLTYLPHLKEMFKTVADPKVKKNYCHGTLMMIKKLLEHKPKDLVIQQDDKIEMMKLLKSTLWIIEPTQTPCYLIIDEYLQIVNLLLWKFPTFLNNSIINNIKCSVEEMIFAKIPTFSHPARQICLSNAMYLYLIIQFIQKDDTLTESILNGLQHHCYDVQISVMNYILILHNKLEQETDNFHKHWSNIVDKNILPQLQAKEQYTNIVCDIYKDSKYLECTQKSLLLLSLEGNLERRIMEIKCEKPIMSDAEVIENLLVCIKNEYENVTDIYLWCLLKFVRRKLCEGSLWGGSLLGVVKTLRECSGSWNNQPTRVVVAHFLQQNFQQIMDFDQLSSSEEFEVKSTVYIIVFALLEDEELEVRSVMCSLVRDITSHPLVTTIPSWCVRRLVHHVSTLPLAIPILLAVSVADFRAEVKLTDHHRTYIFDQNEKHNMFMEESILSQLCIQKIKEVHRTKCSRTKLMAELEGIIKNPEYRDTIVKLSNHHLVTFVTLIMTKGRFKAGQFYKSKDKENQPYSQTQ